MYAVKMHAVKMQLQLVISFVAIIMIMVTAGYPSSSPNMVIFLADDLGYGDLQSYGHPTQERGPIDDLASEGMRFTSMYTASSLCSPSRAALLTGRLPVRIGAYGQLMNFYHTAPNGLPKEEITLPEILRDVGYATGMVGKWHLGINGYEPMDGVHLPHHHGFDWVGTNLPYTNVWECDESKKHLDAPMPRDCFLYDNDTIIQQPFSHDGLTARFVDDAKMFIRQQVTSKKPFFLYLSFAQTHVSLFSDRRTSKRGFYGDNVREMSWAVGEVMDEMKTLGIDQNTITYFTSDNGAHIELCNEGGDNGVLKGGKTTYYEGGIRVPGILKWPGQISAGKVTPTVVSQMDIYTTLVNLAGGQIPTDRIVDGQDITELILSTKQNPEKHRKNAIKIVNRKRVLFFYCNHILFAVRYGKYKIHYNTMPIKTREEYGFACGEGGFPNSNYFDCLFCPSDCVINHAIPLVYNVEADPGELYNLNATLSQELLDKVSLHIEAHTNSMQMGSPLFNDWNPDSHPCCNQTDPTCSCNYP